MQHPGGRTRIFVFVFVCFVFFGYSETDSAMKKRTAESLYEMMQPLSDHNRIHTRHCKMLRFYKVLQTRHGAALA